MVWNLEEGRMFLYFFVLHGKATEEDTEESQIRGPRVEQREGGEGPRKHIYLMTGALLSNLQCRENVNCPFPNAQTS